MCARWRRETGARSAAHRAGLGVRAWVSKYLRDKLRLKVNEEKSAVAPVEARKFLGYRLRPDGSLGIAPESLRRLKARVRQITRRNRGISLARRVAELNAYLPGWVAYLPPRPLQRPAAAYRRLAAA